MSANLANKAMVLNPPQLRSALLHPKKEVDVWSRATGKSSGFAWKISQVTQAMPRMTGAFAGATYRQILTRTLPTTIEALEKIGYHKDVHFFIGKKPPASMRFMEPYQAPLDYERFMVFKNGTGFHLTSQDREGMNRGTNLGFIFADELLTMDKKKLEDEVFASNRGGNDRFGKSPLHHGWHMATSMPTSAKSAWILEYSNYYQEDGNPIWIQWNKMCQLQLKWIDSKSTEEKQILLADWKKIRKSIRFYISKEGILFSLGNVFDNLQNVGLDFIRDMRRQMTTTSFRIEILNERINTVEQCFYSNLRDDLHVYDAPNYSYLDGLEYDFERLKKEDSRMDADVDPRRPLDIGVDWGAEINAMRVCQEHHYNLKGEKEWQYRYLRSLYVKHPRGLKDLANDFADYYSAHSCKEVNLPYDHTAIARDPVRDKYIEELRRYLEERGWKVNAEYLGATPSHHNRYLLWEIMLREGDPRFPVVRFNRTGDKDGLLSMQLAGLKQGRKGFEKDKSSERSTVIPREQATDLSDAGDICLYWRYGKFIGTDHQEFSILGL